MKILTTIAVDELVSSSITMLTFSTMPTNIANPTFLIVKLTASTTCLAIQVSTPTAPEARLGRYNISSAAAWQFFSFFLFSKENRRNERSRVSKNGSLSWIFLWSVWDMTTICDRELCANSSSYKGGGSPLSLRVHAAYLSRAAVLPRPLRSPSYLSTPLKVCCTCMKAPHIQRLVRLEG